MSKNKMEELLLELQDLGPELYVGIAAVILTSILLYIVIRVSRGKKLNTVLLTGLSGAGKTALFYQGEGETALIEQCCKILKHLRDGSTHQGTVTSMEPNDDCFILHSEISKKGKIKPVRIVDLPGHPRLRSKLDEYLPQAAGIVFLVDALDFLQHNRATAEYLYEILTRAFVVKKKIPVLIVCNKGDKVTAHSKEFIKKQLEKEIDKLRASRNSISAADITNEVTLGVQGQPFSFTQCINKVAVVDGSALLPNITEIEKFIRECVKPW